MKSRFKEYPQGKPTKQQKKLQKGLRKAVAKAYPESEYPRMVIALEAMDDFIAISLFPYGLPDWIETEETEEISVH